MRCHHGDRLVSTATAATHLVLLDGIGHFPMVSAPDRVADEIVAWCAGDVAG